MEQGASDGNVVEDGGTDRDRISDLPEEILHNILYYLPSEEEAARTCVLSKSWRYVWRDRLIICFDEKSPLFDGPDRTESFISHVRNALQSHLDRNNRIDTFRLVVTSSESVPLVEKWIPMLRAIGVKVLLLSIIPQGSRNPTSYVDLPSSVFIEPAKSLRVLQLARCNLGGPMTTSSIPFDRLKKLVLQYVNFTDDQHIFDKIFSSCPLVTLVTFEECTGLKTIKLLGDDDDDDNPHHHQLRHKHLKYFTFFNNHAHSNDECSVEIHGTPTLVKIDVFGSKIRFHGHKFGNLKILRLSFVIFSGDSFDFSSCYEFPCLEKLLILYCEGWGQFGGQLMRINAPKMLYFQYQGRPSYPPITFTTPISRECKSDITVEFHFDDDLSWFLELSEFLQQEISPSEICLIVLQNPMRINAQQLDINIDNVNNPPVVVEEFRLNMGHLSSFPSFLNVMFSICRPRYITPQKYYWREAAPQGRDKEELTEFFCRNQELFTRHQDFEEFSIESFDTSLEQWQPVMMSECASLPESYPIRFRLKWSEAAATCDSSSKS